MIPYVSLITYLHFWTSRREIDSWFDKNQVFFILAIGRSGTKFLANLLSLENSAVVYHEPVRDDYKAYLQAYQNPEQAMEYLDKFRKKEIYLRARGNRSDKYGEVNSLLRRHAVALKETFPKAKLIHLVRDGRDVVRSMMSRKTMSPMDKNTHGIAPKDNDPYKEKWKHMDRFTRICWYWQIENSFLRTNIDNSVKFEDIIRNYDIFNEKILIPCNLNVGYDAWSERIVRPINITNQYSLPHWSKWSQEQKDTFKVICEEEMNLNGYSLEDEL